MQIIKIKKEYREIEPRDVVVGIDGVVMVGELEISVGAVPVVELVIMVGVVSPVVGLGLVIAQMSIEISSTATLTASVAFEET